MKTFREYLVENEKTYNYRIKIVGDVTTDFIKSLTARFDQFDPASISSTKTTPIRYNLSDFPDHQNDSVTFFDVSFRYPAIEPQIKDIAHILGLDPNRIIMLTDKFDDAMMKNAEDTEKQNTGLLINTDFPEPDKEQKEASKEYAASPYDHNAVKNAYKSDFTIAGGKTPEAETTNDIAQGVKSPMTDIKRPPKPATGAKPRG